LGKKIEIISKNEQILRVGKDKNAKNTNHTAKKVFLLVKML